MDGWIETGCVAALLLTVGGGIGLADRRNFSARWLLVAAALVVLDDALLTRMHGTLPHLLPHGHVWTPPTVQGESQERLSRSRVLPCVRPLVRLKRRGPVWENEDQIHITGPRSKRSP